MTNIEERVAAIESRNERVEREKAWEISATRRVGILMVTYTLCSLVMWQIGNEQPLISAIIPTLGYGISTLSLGWLKHHWIKKESPA